MKSRKLVGVFMVLLVFGLLIEGCVSFSSGKETSLPSSPESMLSMDKPDSAPEPITSEYGLQYKLFEPIWSLNSSYMPIVSTNIPKQEDLNSISNSTKLFKDGLKKFNRLDELELHSQLGKYFPYNYVFDYNEFYRQHYTPNYQTPRFVKPDFQIPDNRLSRISDFQMHDFKITDNIKPDLQIPKIQIHDIQIPKQSVTEITIPSQIPNMKVHDLSKQYIIRPNLPKNKVPMF